MEAWEDPYKINDQREALIEKDSTRRITKDHSTLNDIAIESQESRDKRAITNAQDIKDTVEKLNMLISSASMNNIKVIVKVQEQYRRGDRHSKPQISIDMFKSL